MAAIKLDGQYQTRDGRKVRRVLCIDRNNNKHPVVVELEDGVLIPLTSEGNYYEVGNSGYDLTEIKPLHETLKVDDKVMVRYGWSSNAWHRGYFSHYSNGYYHTFAEGCTSWSGVETCHWRECRLPTPEELNSTNLKP